MDTTTEVKPVQLASPSSSPSTVHLEIPSPAAAEEVRGTKRSRTPDNRSNVGSENDDDDEGPASKPRKRRLVQGSKPPSPPPSNGASNSADNTSHLEQQASSVHNIDDSVVQTKTLSGPIAPLNITSEQLSEDRSGYIETEQDPEGEKNVLETGHLTAGRSYRARTFHLPDRDEKLFMLATECAKVLVFRDSYLLFNKNKSLHKIIATQSDKESLITQGILPFSYRSRQIALVSARSIYRQFGAKMIVDGRRVKDDYWQAHARAQGYTEDDFALEKKSGPARPKEQGTDVSSVGATAMNMLGQSQIVYEDAPVNKLGSFVGLPSPGTTPRSVSLYTGVSRPRQDVVGAPYEDRIQPSLEREIIDQAAQASQFNQACAESAKNRRAFFRDYYLAPREVATPEVVDDAPHPDTSMSPRLQRHRQPSSQHGDSQSMNRDLRHQQQMNHGVQHATPAHMMNMQGFARPSHPSMMQASPAQQQQHNLIRRDSTPSHMSQPPQRPNYPFNQGQGNDALSAYRSNGPPGMWPNQQMMAGQPGCPPSQHQQAQHMSGLGPQQSPHSSMQASPMPMGFPGQNLGAQNLGTAANGMNGMNGMNSINGMTANYPRLPQNMFHGGQNPVQNYMQQQQQRMNDNSAMMGQGMGAHQGMPGFHQQQQQQQVQQGQLRQFSGY